MPKKGRRSKKVIQKTAPSKVAKVKKAAKKPKKKKKKAKKKVEPKKVKPPAVEPKEEPPKEKKKEEEEEEVVQEETIPTEELLEEILQTPIIPSYEYPNVGDLVVGTVMKVERNGAYVRLEEYKGKEGLIHVSEVSGSWVRNIKRHIRERQKLVAKVLRINRKRGHIDLSLRRVGQDLKREKIFNWRVRQRENNTLALVMRECIETGVEVTRQELYEKVAIKFETSFGRILSGFEEARDNGDAVLKKAGIPQKFHAPILKISQIFAETSRIKLSGKLTLRTYANDGVSIIRTALENVLNLKLEEDFELSIYTIGAPHYHLDVKARDYDVARAVIKKLSNEAISYVVNHEGEGSYEILKE